MRRPLLFLLGTVITLSSCQRNDGNNVMLAGSAGAGNVNWDSFVQSYLDAYFALHPEVAVSAGRHEFDGKLPDWSSDGLSKQISMLRDWKTRALAFDSTKLDAPSRLERDYLVSGIDGELWWLVRADGPHTNPAFYADKLDPDVYLTRPYAPLADRMRAYTAHARAVATAAGQIRANLKAPLPRTFIDRGKGIFGGFAEFFANDVPKVFAGVNDAKLTREFAQANDSAVKAMKQLDAWLDSLRATQTEKFAIGPEAFRAMLHDIELVDTPLDTLERMGRADLERNLAALREACSRFAPGAPVVDCIRRLSSHKPSHGAVDEARNQLVDLRRFVIDNKIVTIPSEEQIQVAESPPYQRYNSAYMQPPGPYEKNMPSRYYVAPPDPSWTPKEQEEYIPGVADLLFTSVHEVWPGHFLQFLHANRSRSKFGQVFVGYAYAEGWAHYTEEMMWEAGYGAGDPEKHIGQLMNALLRNVRFLSAIGLHTKGMTVAESEKMFREKAYQDPGNARQQAARGTFDPEYLDYTMGKLMIRKLRDDWTATRGGRSAWQQFHDTFLSYGGPPIPLVRRAMMEGKTSTLF